MRAGQAKATERCEWRPVWKAAEGFLCVFHDLYYDLSGVIP